MQNIYHSIQGNMGLGKAIEYFTSQGIPVALPLNDTQKYDLIADFNNKLQKISVKTSRCLTENNTYQVNLRNIGGASGKYKNKAFDNTKVDYVFIYTANEDLYLIPSKEIIATNAIKVGKKYIEYKVKVKTLFEYANEILEP